MAKQKLKKLEEIVTIRLPDNTHENLDYINKEYGISKSYLIRKAIEQYLENNYAALIREKENFWSKTVNDQK